MFRKSVAVFCCLLVFFPSISVFAWDGVQEGGHYEKETEVGKLEDLWGAKNNDQSPGKTPTNSPSSSSGGNSGNSSGSSSGSNSEGGSSPVVVEWEIKLLEIRRTPPIERTHVEEKTLYWEWEVVSGPGSMTVHSSDRKVEQVGGIWRAGQRVVVSFSAAGTYTVRATEVREKTTTVTPVTTVERRYLIKEYIRTNPSGTGFNQTNSYIYTTTGEEYGTPTQTKEIVRRPPVTYTVRVLDPGKKGALPPLDKNLETTSRVIFSRQYVYTDDIIDAKTGEGFVLEVIYEFTANTTIRNVSIEHIVTRYKNMGTMVVVPVEWKPVFYNNNKSVRIWAKFKYKKAGMKDFSPMLFNIDVDTTEGIRTVGDKIDVPVNTLNGRFTNLPESQTGDLYPINGVSKVNNQEYVRDFGTIIYHAIYVP